VSEVREAVDFLRYYANEAERVMAPQTLPGPTGESNTLRLEGRGAWVCISPWNFPLAIFMGQVAAALATGNTVLAKPAEQTPAVALEAVKLLHAAGVPADALQLLHGPGETVGAALVAHPAWPAWCSPAHPGGQDHPARAGRQGRPHRAADRRDRRHQRHAGGQHGPARAGGRRGGAERLPQRRPALLGAAPAVRARGIADGVIEMIQGAAKELVAGDPAELATDLGPVIDAEAFDGIQRHLQRLRGRPRPLLPEATRRRGAQPGAAADVRGEGHRRRAQEIFGPVLQVVRWGGDPMDVIRRSTRWATA
jgi:RHH-type transcriptional regulator, proline utilization regulon repressor / proline dehydrogenase / delta 1-pyrroline-5-carboxylate dehydrogenase